MRPFRCFPLLVSLCLSVPGQSQAQPAPANIRDGYLTGYVPSGFDFDVDLFVVPSGTEFVLTDVQVYASPRCNLVDDLGTIRWLSLDNTGGYSGRSWSTGLRFGPGRSVRMRFLTGGSSYTVSWSGYVAPVATTAVPTTDEASFFGLRIGPNPTGSGATISFQLDRGGPVALGIYDANGRLIRRLQSGVLAAGSKEIMWDGRDRKGKSVDSGVYFARLETKQERQTTKVVVTH